MVYFVQCTVGSVSGRIVNGWLTICAMMLACAFSHIVSLASRVRYDGIFTRTISITYLLLSFIDDSM